MVEFGIGQAEHAVGVGPAEIDERAVGFWPQTHRAAGLHACGERHAIGNQCDVAAARGNGARDAERTGVGHGDAAATGFADAGDSERACSVDQSDAAGRGVGCIEGQYLVAASQGSPGAGRRHQRGARDGAA